MIKDERPAGKNRTAEVRGRSGMRAMTRNGPTHGHLTAQDARACNGESEGSSQKIPFCFISIGRRDAQTRIIVSDCAC